MKYKTRSKIIDGVKFVSYDPSFDENRPCFFTVKEDKEGFIVNAVHIPKELQNQGLATNFHLMQNTLSKQKTKKPLRCSNDLTKEGAKLWDSFHKKGIALNFVFI